MKSNLLRNGPQQHWRPAARAMLIGATILAGANPAMAQTAKPTTEARLQQLEADLESLKAELAAERARNAQMEQSQQATQQRVTAIETKPVPVPPPPPDGFKVGATTVKLNGFVKTTAAFSRWGNGDVAGNSLGRDFYVPAAIPVGGTRESTDMDMNAKQTRLWLTMATPVGNHKMGAHVEFDFQTAPGTQGSERTTNGYNLALRRGFVTYDNWLIGQEWSNFQYPGALPESTDFVGVSEGTVFVRQPQIRYTHKMSDTASLSVALENPETATVTTASAAMVEQDDDRIPDLTARLLFKPTFGEVSIATLFRSLSVDNGAVGARSTGWGISGAGKFPFGPDKRHNVSMMLTYGDGIGRYVGLNFGPDAVVYAPGTGQLALAKTSTLAGFGAVRLGVTPTTRINLMASFQNVDSPAAYRPSGLNNAAYSFAGNIFWSPTKGFDVGVEYRHAVREIWATPTTTADGTLDRLEFAFRYNF